MRIHVSHSVNVFIEKARGRRDYYYVKKKQSTSIPLKRQKIIPLLQLKLIYVRTPCQNTPATDHAADDVNW